VRITADSFVSQLIAAMAAKRYTAKAIQQFLEWRGYISGHSIATIYYHAYVHGVKMSEERSDQISLLEDAREFAGNKGKRIPRVA